MNRLPVTIACLLLAAFIAAGAVVALLWAPLNPDAGLFIPLAREIARGKVLYSDLACDYPPLVPYALSLLGPRLLAQTQIVVAVLLVVQLLNAGLLAWLVARLGHAASVRWLAAIVYLAWVWACDGTAVLLEPLVSLGLLAAALAATWPGWLAAIVCGLATGVALASKQYAVLALPGIFVLLLAGRRAQAERPAEEPERSRAWLRLLLWVVCAVAPLLAMAVLVGVQFNRLVAQLATFGGRDYEAGGPRQLFLALTTGGPAAPLVAIAILAVWLLLTQRRLGELALALLLLGASAPLLIRDYPHYVQLPAPWGVLIMVETAAMLSRRFAGHGRGTAQLLLWGSLIFVPAWLAAAGALLNTALDRPRADQQAVAALFAPEADGPSDEMLFAGAPWLYALVNRPAPLGDYRFVPRLVDEQEARPLDARVERLLAQSRWIVLIDEALTSAADRWLRENGWIPRQIAAGPAADRVAVYERPRPAAGP